jgi:hypothetical protein
MQSLSPAIQRIACDEPAHGRPQAAGPSWTSPSKARSSCFWPTRISARHVACSSVAYPSQPHSKYVRTRLTYLTPWWRAVFYIYYPTDCPCEEGYMSRASLKNIWLQLPAFGALMLGALLAGGARADRSQLQPPEATPEPSRRLASRLDEVAIRIEGEKIYISQRGSAFEDLRLGDTPDAAHLRKLLRDAGAEGQSVSVPIGSMIVASGGGSGSGQKPKQKTSKETTDPGKSK